MVNFNGDLLPADSHFLNHQNRGLLFGDAITEHLRFAGSNIIFWEQHYFRLMASMRQLRMEIPMNFTLEYLEGEILKTKAASGLSDSDAEIKIVIFRIGGVDFLPETTEVSYIIEVRASDGFQFRSKGGSVRADLFRDYYLQADALAKLPHNNRIPYVLAAIYTDENDLETCLLLNHRKEVCEGLHGTVFLRKGSLLKTPPLDSGCKEGILRSYLLQYSWLESPYSLEEAVISPFELQQADELFLVHDIKGILPVTNYRKASYGREASIFIEELLNSQVSGELN